MNDSLLVAIIGILIVLLGICFIGWMVMWADRDEYHSRLDREYEYRSAQSDKHRDEVEALAHKHQSLVYRIQEEIRRPQGV